VRDADGRLRRKQLPVGRYQEVIPDAHEPLITSVQHAKVRAIFESHKDRRRSPIARHFVRELTGLVFCGHCQHQMSHHCGKEGKYLRLRCSLVEMVAHGQTVNGHQEDQEINGLVEAIRELQGMHDPDLGEAIERKRKRLERLMSERMAQSVPQVTTGLRQALQDERFWEVAQGDEQLTRRMFTEMVEQAVVRNGAVELVQLRVGG
jgi:hypothetical protein